MTSKSYCQESGDRGQESGSHPQFAIQNPQSIDPENRLLWRMNERKLSFEELRDSLLAASGRLDRTVGGRAGDLFSAAFTRRSLYGTIDRQFLPGTLRVFDFANPDLHIPKRSETTVPQQALFFLNDPLLLEFAKLLAARASSAASSAERVRQLYDFAYQRPPTDEQLQAALAFLDQAAAERVADEPPAAVRAWQYGYGGYDEEAKRVTSFEKLPHFTGSAWQGGSAYPDAKLGWVQLTAAGGHPGNDKAHAAIRRWTAPRAMQVEIASTLVHEPEPGQGLRGFIVSSRDGELARASVHHGRAELNVGVLDVQAGDTIDFVADIGNELSHNQFLWQVTIASASGPSETFDSKRDFAGQPAPQLDLWEQLAQVLLSANEFLFVD